VRCVVALGTNQGDRFEISQRALADIQATEGFRLIAHSSLHETVALTAAGPDPDAPGYLNQIILVWSAWSPEKTLEHLLEIEARHGRVRNGETHQPRTLDLDLISYGDRVDSNNVVTLPHPRAHERRFVLAPWLEVDPEASLPGIGDVSSLLAALPPDSP